MYVYIRIGGFREPIVMKFLTDIPIRFEKLIYIFALYKYKNKLL